MSPALVTLLVALIPAVLQFIEFLIQNRKHAGPLERRWLLRHKSDLENALPYMTLEQNEVAVSAIARIKEYLADN